ERELVRRRTERLRRAPRGEAGRGRLDLPHHAARGIDRRPVAGPPAVIARSSGRGRVATLVNAKEGTMNWSPMHLLAGSMVSLALFGCGSNGGSETAGDSTVSGDSKLPRGGQPVNLDPSKFTTKIDNPYWPLSPGSQWVYREIENGVNQKVVVTVTDRTKVI